MSDNAISHRVQNIIASKSIAVAAEVEKLKRQGVQITGLNVGEPDFPVDQHIKDATAKAIMDNKARYSLVEGVVELRESICQYLNEDHDFNVTPDNILVSNGSKQVIYNIFQLLVNPGDEVIIPLPYWVTYPEAIKLAGGTPVYTKALPSLLPDIEDIEKKITSKTKMIILNSPGNPSGRVYPDDVIKRIGQLALKNNIWILSDEAYDELTYDSRFKSPATFDEEWAKLILPVKSFSKSFCMTGYRLGFLAASPELIKEMKKFQGHVNGNPCTFAQYGAIAALNTDRRKLLEKRKNIFHKRRETAYELASKHFEFDKPEGAFYLFPNVSKYLGKNIKTSEDLCIHILNQAHVALLPGECFGLPGHLRIAFANSEEHVEEAFKKMAPILQELL